MTSFNPAFMQQFRSRYGNPTQPIGRRLPPQPSPPSPFGPPGSITEGADKPPMFLGPPQREVGRVASSLPTNPGTDGGPALYPPVGGNGGGGGNDGGSLPPAAGGDYGLGSGATLPPGYGQPGEVGQTPVQVPTDQHPNDGPAPGSGDNNNPWWRAFVDPVEAYRRTHGGPDAAAGDDAPSGPSWLQKLFQHQDEPWQQNAAQNQPSWLQHLLSTYSPNNFSGSSTINPATGNSTGFDSGFSNVWGVGKGPGYAQSDANPGGYSGGGGPGGFSAHSPLGGQVSTINPFVAHAQLRTGGRVPGPTLPMSAPDNVNARLKSGEVVLNTDQQKAVMIRPGMKKHLRPDEVRAIYAAHTKPRTV